MADLRKDAVSMLQDTHSNEKRLEEHATLTKNNEAINLCNKKMKEWKLQLNFELTPHNLMTLISKAPYYTIDLSAVIQSLIELGNLTLTANPLNILSNEAAALGVSVWEKSRNAINAFILNYPQVTQDTQKHVDALNETLKATINVVKNPQEVGVIKNLLEKNNALFDVVEPSPLLRKLRGPLYVNSIASVCEKVNQFALCLFSGAAIMFCLTCLAPSISVVFAKITLASFATVLATNLLRNALTGKTPIPEINDLRRAEDTFAKSASSKEYHALKGGNVTFFAKKAPAPAATTAAPAEIKVSGDQVPLAAKL